MSVHFPGLFSRFTFLVSKLTATVTFEHGQAWMYSQLTIKKTRQIKNPPTNPLLYLFFHSCSYIKVIVDIK